MKRSPYLFELTRLVSHCVFPFTFRVEVAGLSRLPEKGPAFLIPKHQRWWDVPLLGTHIPRPLVFLAKQELFQSSAGRFFISRLGGIPIDRNAPIRSLNTFRSLVPLLRQGAFLVLFPEGTYFPDAMGPGRWRLISLILNLQGKKAMDPVPFYPVGIRYAPRSSGGRRRVAIRVGEALQEADPARAEAFTEKLLRRVQKLSGL